MAVERPVKLAEEKSDRHEPIRKELLEDVELIRKLNLRCYVIVAVDDDGCLHTVRNVRGRYVLDIIGALEKVKMRIFGVEPDD